MLYHFTSGVQAQRHTVHWGVSDQVLGAEEAHGAGMRAELRQGVGDYAFLLFNALSTIITRFIYVCGIHFIVLLLTLTFTHCTFSYHLNHQPADPGCLT